MSCGQGPASLITRASSTANKNAFAAATDMRGRGSQNAIPRPIHPEH
ncbi:MAG: hypothetical protein WBQ14_09435 [Gaiellaceae bacterium]